MHDKSRARELTLIQLFQIEFGSDEQSKVTEIFSEKSDVNQTVLVYAKELLAGITGNLDQIDEKIQNASRHWKVERLSKVDRNVLRVAVFEMLFAQEPLKPSIAINEAVNIAKVYGSTESGSFVNGLLDQIFQDHDGNNPT